MRIEVGVAGWDYPDWVGPVYPSHLKGLAKLRFLSRFLRLVEINNTFYRPNLPEHAEKWVHTISANKHFIFTAKAWRQWTHSSEPLNTQACLEGLRPLHEAARLGALLVQFPASFDAQPAHLRRLHEIAEATTGWPVVMELRHRQWKEQEIWEPFAERGISRCIVDQPRAGGQLMDVEHDAASPIAYLRLHGRRAAAWFDPKASVYDRYDYRYTREELKLLLKHLNANPNTTHAYAVANNHPRGQALVNALQIRDLIGDSDLEAPAGLTRAFKDDLTFAKNVNTQLF